MPERTANALRSEEALGYLVEIRPDIPLLRKLIARIKTFRFRMFGIGAKHLSADNMVVRVQASAQRATSQLQRAQRQDEAAYSGEQTDTSALKRWFGN